MAINPIQVQARVKQSGLEKLALGLDIISKTLGTALAIPKFLQEQKIGEQQGKINESELIRKRAETKATIGTKYRPVQQGEDTIGSIDVGQEYGGQVKLREVDEFSDRDKAVYQAYSADFQPTPEPTQNSIKVPIGGKDTYWEPKATQTTDRRFNQEQSLRKEFLSQSAPFINQAEGYGRVLSGFKEKTGPGDIAGIYGYIKLLDPHSAVREGEIALAGQAKSVPDWALGWYNKAVAGELLPPEVRQRFLNSAKGLYSTAKKFQDVREENYSNIARDNDVNPHRIIGNLGTDIISSIEKSVSGIEHLSDDELSAQIAKRRGIKKP